MGYVRYVVRYFFVEHQGKSFDLCLRGNNSLIQLLKLAMKKILFVPALLTALFFTACEPALRGKGDLTTETRDLSNFHALDISTQGRVDVRTDSVFSVEITCEENILPYLETYVDNGVLKIYFSRNVWDVNGLRIRIGAPAWDAFELSGSGNVYVPDPIVGDDLKLRLSGSGKIKIDDANFVYTSLKVSGSGDVYLSGQGDELFGTLSGSGNVEARYFPVKKATVKVSGSGNIRLNVSETLDATVSGSGNVEYLGSPHVDKDVSGSGKVRKL